MSNESAAFCQSDKAVNKIADNLNKGKGDDAQQLLLQCTQMRAQADPEQHKAWKDMMQATKPEDWGNAAERDAAAMAKIETKIWQDVVKAQGAGTGKQLCKLELIKNGETVTGAEIKKSATCNITEYTMKDGKIVPLTKDSN
ncbi:MAG: hypothetical protein P4L53_13430 [Candidatus Obscuribacterales bacterium]|nr:hypothetical protein [Candidatus Obscuribacterales bacterium]